MLKGRRESDRTEFEKKRERMTRLRSGETISYCTPLCLQTLQWYKRTGFSCHWSTLKCNIHGWKRELKRNRLAWSQDRETDRTDERREKASVGIGRQRNRTEMRESEKDRPAGQRAAERQCWEQEQVTGPTARERGGETARSIVLHCVLRLKREIKRANTEECSRKSGCFIARYWVMPLYTCGSVFVRDRHICVSALAVPASQSAMGSDSRLLWVSGSVLVELLNDKITC